MAGHHRDIASVSNYLLKFFYVLWRSPHDFKYEARGAIVAEGFTVRADQTDVILTLGHRPKVKGEGEQESILVKA